MPRVREETVTDLHGPWGLKHFENFLQKEHTRMWKNGDPAWARLPSVLKVKCNGEAISQMSVWKEPGWLKWEEAEGMWEMKLWWEAKQEAMMSRFDKRAAVTSGGTGCWRSCLESGSWRILDVLKVGDMGIMISKFDLEYEIATILEKSLTY